MEYKQFVEILKEINSSLRCDLVNYTEWKNDNFNPDYLFKFEDNFNGEHKCTLLHLAAENGCTRIVDALISIGADVNAVDQNGNTALHLVKDCCTNIISALRAKGANVNAKNNDGNTPLHLAAQNNYGEKVSDLIDRGADANVKNNDGKVPLNLADPFEEAGLALMLFGNRPPIFKVDDVAIQQAKSKEFAVPDPGGRH